MAYDHLFSPIKNRIALMPMGVLSPRMMNRDASYTKDWADYYIERAKGGAGLIITGMAPIPPGEFLSSIVNNPATYTENTKYLADGIHRYGSKVFIMISAMSGRSGTPGSIAASALPNVWDPRCLQKEMTTDEICCRTPAMIC